ncbi:phosphoesterase [Komagataeibacter xylinus NBRC 13693]|uniref:Phosphoesterase n=1 Tax=Komagataeibacter xylinus NBRC 13693 TaxID=1234668 RepID=A0A0D6Q9S8_KOMXY|nr:phosphatase PAP2 family protein [Komagataeibacter xylinus]GAO00089.1 phosphoesterase [Komagataeibacter xylinus NBRC 13693]
MMQFITDFADQADILPVVATAACVMGVRGWWRGMWVWCTVIGLALGTMLLLKIAGLYYAWFMQARVFSPSGHVAAAIVTYGGLLVMLLRRVLVRHPVAMLVPLLGVAGVVGYTRWRLQAHTMGEVMVGTCVGCIAGLVLGIKCGPVPRSLWGYMLPCIAGVALLFHGFHLGAEATIRQVFSPEGLFPDHL